MRALIVAYAFPPTGGAGVGRPLKLVKYLGHHDVSVSVLTAKNPSVPVSDASLVGDVPPGTPIQRVRTFEPSYRVKQIGWSAAADQAGGSTNTLASRWKGRVRRAAVTVARQALIPDPQVLWQPAAQAALAGRLVRGLDDVVFISAPPFSQFMLAPLARLRPGVGVVLDYRDEWSTVREVYEMKGNLPARQARPWKSGCCAAPTRSQRPPRHSARICCRGFRFFLPNTCSRYRTATTPTTSLPSSPVRRRAPCPVAGS